MNLLFKKSIFLILLIGSSASVFCDSVTAVVVDSSEDAKTAFERVKLLAKAGNAEAQAQLADFYLAGKGVAKNVQKAFKYYKKAGQLKVLRAQLAVADAYYYGHDVAQSYKKSLKWYRMAAEQDCADAQHRLGEMYRDGLGVAKKNTDKALVWFKKASDRGLTVASSALAELQKTLESLKS